MVTLVNNETCVPFIYGLADPIAPGHVRYVGMATNSSRRPFDHVTVALRVSKKQQRPSHTTSWIRTLIANNREPLALLLEQLPKGAPNKFVGFVEQCYIKSLRSIGHDLTNGTDGGYGGFNGPHTAETREIISKTHKGKTRTQEERAAMSAGRKGMKFTAEHRQHLSEAHLGYKWPPEQIAKRSASHSLLFQARRGVL